jgi:hypothetical protein
MQVPRGVASRDQVYGYIHVQASHYTVYDAAELGMRGAQRIVAPDMTALSLCHTVRDEYQQSLELSIRSGAMSNDKTVLLLPVCDSTALPDTLPSRELPPVPFNVTLVFERFSSISDFSAALRELSRSSVQISRLFIVIGLDRRKPILMTLVAMFT